MSPPRCMDASTSVAAAPSSQKEQRVVAEVVTSATVAGVGWRRWVTARPSRSDLGARLLKGVGDRVFEAQRAAVALGGIPGVCAVARACRPEELRVEPGVDRVFGPIDAILRCGAEQARGSVVVAADYRDGGEAL
jgi:hypothetical protein